MVYLLMMMVPVYKTYGFDLKGGGVMTLRYVYGLGCVSFFCVHSY